MHIHGLTIEKDGPFFIIAGPCVIENEERTLHVAEFLRETSHRLDIPVIFKSSYDKANRTSLDSFRGPGLDKGLEVLSKVKHETGLPLLSDVHRISEVDTAAEVLDIIQIPAFLCRQTDLVLAAAKTGKPVNIKKGQFLSPWEIRPVIDKIGSVHNDSVIVTERGTFFGYNNLVVDFRSLGILKGFGVPVVFDATHSIQLPGGAGTSSGGQREYAAPLARAAVAAGADGVFMEIHPDPECALCDGPNSLPLEEVGGLFKVLKRLHRIAREQE